MIRLLQLALIALALAGAFAPRNPSLVERWYSTGIYPVIQRSVTPVSNAVPLAVFDVLSIGATAWVVVVLVTGVAAARRTKSWRPLGIVAGRLATCAALGYLSFLGLWGLNYGRLPMSERLEVAAEPPDARAVLSLGLTAAARMNALHGDAHAGGWEVAPWDSASLTKAFAGVQRALTDTPGAVPGRLKSSLYGAYFRWSGVDGMINPFGLEALRNPDLLPFEMPFVAAHEWAHLAGYADESEASFVGWLTCLGGDASAQYSGWLSLYWQVNGETDAEGRRRLATALAGGPRRDVEAMAVRLRQQVRPLRDASWRAYDGYLKANGVDAGVGSYGDFVTLLLRARFEDGWVPVRRRAEAER